MTRSQEEQILAQSFGAVCKPDKNRGTGWCKFQLGNWHIWEFASLGSGCRWQCALLRDNYYTNHCPQDTLSEALNYCKNRIEQAED